MEDAIENIGNIFITLSISIVVVAVIGYLLIPLLLKKFGVSKNYRILISKLSVIILLGFVFLTAFSNLSV